SAYAWLMQVSAPWRVGTHAYVNPLIAVALGAAVAGEPLTSALIVSAAVIAGSVALILVGQGPHAAAAPAAGGTDPVPVVHEAARSAVPTHLRARRVVSSLRETRQPDPA